MIYSQNKLLKLFLIIPLFIAFTIFCYGLQNHKKSLQYKVSVKLPKPIQPPTDTEISEYFKVNLTNNPVNLENFQPSEDSNKTDSELIPITTKTSISKTIPQIKDSIITREYEVFLDDQVSSKEYIKVHVDYFAIKNISYYDKSSNEKKNISNNLFNQHYIYDWFLKTPLFKNSTNQIDDVILKASKQPGETNPKLKLDLKQTLNYQILKEYPIIKELISKNVDNIELEIDFTIKTIED
ncbi:hypothetical protein [Candidatus Phytoplasma mali]|nr:hypothetical protein [Candidatus Phytoplasma mali]